MALTYSLIASNVLSSTAANVTFSSIPSTYTDLLLFVSARGDVASSIANLDVTINNITGTSYSYTYLLGNGATASSNRGSSVPAFFLGHTDATNSLTGVFGSAEIYIPSYTANRIKPIAGISIQENNTITARQYGNAGLWNNTSAITSIRIAPDANNWIASSSFYLYGIKNT